MYAENMNLHEAQGSRIELMPSHSEANDSAAPPINTVPEQNYDVSTPPDALNKQILNEPRVISRRKMKKLSKIKV